MGIHVSMSDYRLIFEKLDYDKGGEVDYFKFCLLDYDKEATREQLIEKYSLKQIKGLGQTEENSCDDLDKEKEANIIILKNRAPNAFIQEIAEGDFKQQYLNKKSVINNQF